MNGTFESAGNTLACHVTSPVGRTERTPGLILCHGFPIGPLDARRSAGTFPELIDRIAHDVGYIAMTFTFRGCGTSEGDFSLQGWIDDLRAAIDHLVTHHPVREVVLVGANTGGSIAVCVGADDPRVVAAGLLSPRADFDDWADHPRRFLDHAREIGAIRTPGFPRSFDEWTRAFRRFRPLNVRLSCRRRFQRGSRTCRRDSQLRTVTRCGRRPPGRRRSCSLRSLPSADPTRCLWPGSVRRSRSHQAVMIRW